MICAIYHKPLHMRSVVLNGHAEQKESLRRKQVFFFLNSSPSSLGLKHPKIGLSFQPKATVLPPSESGDITTFLFASAAMISMYLVANFVVPSMLFKSLQAEEEEDSN